jgi:hypothetical protein
MSFADAQWAYDNAREPEYDENPEVLEMCRVVHDEDYLLRLSEEADEEIDSLLLRIATGEKPDDAIIQGFVAALRSHYEKSLGKFTDENYEDFEKDYEESCFSEPDDDYEEDFNAECAW